MRIWKLLTLLALCAGLVWNTGASADVLDDIKKRGKLVVGVKADYKPFGFRDPSGAIVGLEPDLAADVAKKLGVQLELVPVVSANRMEFLNQGKIDLMIATMSDKPERRKISRARRSAAPPAHGTTRKLHRSTAPSSYPSTDRRSRCCPSRTATASATSMTRPSSAAN
jgi:hypothetical protein